MILYGIWLSLSDLLHPRLLPSPPLTHTHSLFVVLSGVLFFVSSLQAGCSAGQGFLPACFHSSVPAAWGMAGSDAVERKNDWAVPVGSWVIFHRREDRFLPCCHQEHFRACLLFIFLVIWFIFCHRHNVLAFSLHENFVKCALSLNFPSNFSTFMLCSLVFISFSEQTLNSVHGSESNTS